MVSVCGAEPQKAAYTLFMGADIAIEKDRVFHRVEGVKGSFFRIRVSGKEELIPTWLGTARMRIDNAMKLAGTPVEVENIKTERDYTPANDPRRKFDKNASSMAGGSAAADLSNFQLRMAQENLAGVSGSPGASASQISDAQYAVDQAAAAQAAAYFSLGSDINSAAYHLQKMESELAEENFDAIRMTLKVSSPVRIEDPYLLVIARIHERDAKPNVYRNWIFAQKIDPIDAEPERIYIYQGGLPVGYSLEETQVRIYSRGQEFPTTGSPNLVQLSRDEAREYIRIEHLAANKDATVPAMPAFGEAPADLKQRLEAGEFAQPFFVKVDAEGNASGAFTDEACTSPANDPYVEAFVSRVIFTPALENGRPVAGVARVHLASLAN